MNLDERIKQLTRDWLDQFEDLQPWEQEEDIEDEVWQQIIDSHKQLIREVLEYVKPELADEGEPGSFNVGWNWVLEEMETKTKELGL